MILQISLICLCKNSVKRITAAYTPALISLIDYSPRVLGIRSAMIAIGRFVMHIFSL